MKNKQHKKVLRSRLYVCPKCLDYHYSIKRVCEKCGCTKGYTSVLVQVPESLAMIPKEDWKRIFDYRKLNGYNCSKYEALYRRAPVLGVRIPIDDKPSYIMKSLRKPKSQRGGFGGIANHAGASRQTRTFSGGSCTPK